jgi:plastocyanin
MQRREYLQRVGAASAVGLTAATAGCGSDGGNGNGSDTTTQTDVETTEDSGVETTEDGTTQTTDDGQTTAEPTDTGPAQVVEVGRDGLNFVPESFTIAAGDTVRWEWVDSGHNVVPDEIPSGSDWSGSEGAPDRTLDEGQTHSHTFETAGSYSYFCNPHKSLEMTGEFTVE